MEAAGGDELTEALLHKQGEGEGDLLVDLPGAAVVEDAPTHVPDPAPVEPGGHCSPRHQIIKRTLNPDLLSKVAPHDVASDCLQALGGGPARRRGCRCR